MAARGLAVGDLDNDGGDLVVMPNDGPAWVVRNETSMRLHWITLEVVGTKSNGDGIRAHMEIAAQAGSRRISGRALRRP